MEMTLCECDSSESRDMLRGSKTRGCPAAGEKKEQVLGWCLGKETAPRRVLDVGGIVSCTRPQWPRDFCGRRDRLWESNSLKKTSL